MTLLKDSEPSGNCARLSVPGRWAVAALAVMVLLVIVVRLRLVQIPLERDEGEYAYAGQLMLEGVPPYKLAYNMKLPGTYAVYAAMMAVFGETTAGIHFGFLLVNLGTLALLFFVARRLLDVAHAVVACVCYALLAMCSGVLGLEGHATHLVVLAALGGLLLLLQARASGRLWTFGWSGLAFGLSFVCKQPGLCFGLCGGVVLLHDLAGAAPPERGGRLKRLGLFCAGLALPFLLTCGLMTWAGTFQRFWFWTVVYAGTHARILTWPMRRGDLAAFNQQAGALRWCWVAAAAGLLCLLRDKGRNEARFVIGCLLAFSLLAFTAGFYFFPHYFIMVLPVVSLLAAIAARRAARTMGEAIPAAGLALACAVFTFSQRALWFEQTPEDACRALYRENPFPEAAPIAQYIQEHSTAKDTIAIMGSEPEICFYARRHSATGYIYMYDLVQAHQYARSMQEEMKQQIEAAKPAFLLLVKIDRSWNVNPGADRSIMDWAVDYGVKYYNVAGKVWLLPDHTEYVWGREAASRTFDTPTHVTILQRRPGI
jgi:4-amino-4-deoxy-L-arabinose transferase-like glycosyltransferase